MREINELLPDMLSYAAENKTLAASTFQCTSKGRGQKLDLK